MQASLNKPFKFNCYAKRKVWFKKVILVKQYTAVSPKACINFLKRKYTFTNSAENS